MSRALHRDDLRFPLKYPDDRVIVRERGMNQSLRQQEAIEGALQSVLAVGVARDAREIEQSEQLVAEIRHHLTSVSIIAKAAQVERVASGLHDAALAQVAIEALAK